MNNPRASTHSWFVFWLGGLCAAVLMLVSGYPIYPASTVSIKGTYPVGTQQFIRTPHNARPWTAELPNLAHHRETPLVVRAVYLSAWTAGTAKRRHEIIQFINNSDNLNAVVIDIKDSTGVVSYTGTDPRIEAMGTYSNRIRNLSSVIKEFHESDIYVIGRITAFEDPHIGTRHDTMVLKNTEGEPWLSRSGSRQWINPANTEYHEYLIAIAREAYELGVDEINLDYIRYPSEGATSDIELPENLTKSEVITQFMITMDKHIRQTSRIPLSIDVFGLTTTAPPHDDLGIGQKWENLIPYTDFIAPMIYPSHYADGSFGYSNPAEFPYEIVQRAMSTAFERTQNMNENVSKLRPWIQDFDLGAQYSEDEVRAQMRSLEELHISSWMSWDPANRYTQAAYTLFGSN